MEELQAHSAIAQGLCSASEVSDYVGNLCLIGGKGSDLHLKMQPTQLQKRPAVVGISRKLLRSDQMRN